ncbi:HalOD1 output domain-containing protein [Halomarina rubra]|uniref:HalOD1 output domain-containing protein n=1 Tax=Halomarina rubra TaxID=2071873 RepID=A0ABD6B151_9EURY|nr:HalOD1 output domain-containing protein [Halomarina rubra]
MNSTSALIPISTRVVERVAERENTSPLSLSPPLTEFVDPDALDALFEHAAGTVAFEAWGHCITVSGDGTVRIDESSDAVSTDSDSADAASSPDGESTPE